MEGNKTWTSREKKISLLPLPDEGDNTLNLAPAFEDALQDVTLLIKEGESYTGDNQYM